MDDKVKNGQVGLALSELRNHHGWKELTDILQSIYNLALEELIRHEDLEARATIKVLQEIVAQIDDKINLGVEARNELNPNFNQE